jgi:hypothetical protein
MSAGRAPYTLSEGLRPSLTLVRKVSKITHLGDTLPCVLGVSYSRSVEMLAEEEQRMYLQRTVRRALRLRLPVTMAGVLLTLLLALAVVGCSFGEGDQKPPRRRRPFGRKFPNLAHLG